jgi:hypothetical protein
MYMLDDVVPIRYNGGCMGNRETSNRKVLVAYYPVTKMELVRNPI